MRLLPGLLNHQIPKNLSFSQHRLTERALSRETTGTSSSAGGPPVEKLKAVPFQLSRKDAEEAFVKYHSSGFFTSLPHGGVKRLAAKYLPFWVISANVRWTVKSAQIGHDYMDTMYNFKMKRNETVWRTRWRSIESGFVGESRYEAADPGMQVYASYSHRRSFLSALSGPANTRIVPFTAQVLSTPDPGILPTIDPFTMKPRIALLFAMEHIRVQETRRAEDHLLKKYQADRTRFVNVEVELSDIRVYPVYVPCYAMAVEYLGRELFTFVHGCSSTQVGGQKFFNTAKVTLIVAAASAALLATGGLATGFWAGVVLPAAVAGTSALLWPLLSLSLRDLWRSWELKRHEDASDRATWDEDFVARYEAYEEESRRSQWKEERQRRYDWGSKGRDGYGQYLGTREPNDNHYQTLGVDPRANKQDIQSAFRTLAMECHPDRFADPKAKEAATKKFQKISAAYTVLRDREFITDLPSIEKICINYQHVPCHLATKRREYDAHSMNPN